jgi:hypothetical protein
MQVENQKASRANGRNSGNNQARGMADRERSPRPAYQRPGGNSGNFAHSVFAAMSEVDDDMDDDLDM